MPSPRTDALRVVAIAADVLALAALWVLAIRARLWVGEAWPFDWFPAVEVLKAVDPDAALRKGFLVVPLTAAVLGWRGRWSGRRRADVDIARTIVDVAIALALVQALFFLAALPGPRTLIVGWAIAAIPALALSQALQSTALRGLRKRRFDPHHTLLVGPDEALADWRAVHAARPEWGVVVCGQVGPDEIDAALLRGPVDEVVAAGLDPQALASVAASCEELGVPLSVDARFVGPNSGAALQELDGLPLLAVGPRRDGLERLAKSVLDRCVALVVLVAVAPLLAAAALAVRAHDGGPALFVQQRVGRHGRRFPLLKLRTMRVGAEREHDALRASHPVDVPAFKPSHDPRVTPVGRWLRRWSLDELPQLINVLRGEMSLVGPRPPLPSEVARYQRWELRRLSVPPGMTGLWQVSGRADLPWERWVALDLEYVDRWTLLGDLWLLARTVPAVLRGTGAR